jgi:hypothetical protein
MVSHHFPEAAMNKIVAMSAAIVKTVCLSSVLAMVAGWSVVLPVSAQTDNVETTGDESLPPRVYGKLYSRDILRGVTIEDVYTFNDRRTTTLGPAYANIVNASSNFIKCNPPTGRKFTYALCYYSGPDSPTGTNSDNPSLPCTLSEDGRYANCTCYAITNELAAAKVPYLVDINAISNLDIYRKTISACGQNGENCSSGNIDAAVCDAINTNLLVPGADAISVFSTLYSQDYSVQGEDPLTSCTGKKAGVYAGCMTAPCQFTGKKDKNGNKLVNCKCPIYDGPYQIGQANQSCRLQLVRASQTCRVPTDVRYTIPRNRLSTTRRLAQRAPSVRTCARRMIRALKPLHRYKLATRATLRCARPLVSDKPEAPLHL